jgi:hypothetical protein
MPVEDFEILSAITNIETFARGLGIRVRVRLNRQYAGGRHVRWRHRKGLAEVMYKNGEIWFVELHWFEAHGIGRREMIDKRRIRRLT